uniref:Reverse transcriptase/retrotransposon-derived protein RNase H-like domain-containing protein n=1 Tax=Amphimedon queenslandica TaxID=400682 RepID=A0A1X7TYS9_AMPQE
MDAVWFEKCSSNVPAFHESIGGGRVLCVIPGPPGRHVDKRTQKDAGGSEEEHCQHLKQVLDCFKEYGVIDNPNSLLHSSLDILLEDGISPLESRVSAVRDFPLPKSQRKLKEFLGLINYYCRFIPQCAQILHPLHMLHSHSLTNSELRWSEECLTAFDHAKTALANTTLLFHPIPGAVVSIMSDASDVVWELSCSMVFATDCILFSQTLSN